MKINDSSGPHGKSIVLVEGNTINPTKSLIVLHGRGASAESILGLAREINLNSDYIVVAPQAAEFTWYPKRFIVPKDKNQPHLNSALERVHTIVSELESQYNIPTEHITIAGFSQGACLTAEYIKQHPTTYQSIGIYSGGLIGSDEEASAAFSGDLGETPIYIGCDKEDFHIPESRVTVSAEILSKHNAHVTLRLYENLGHTIHPEGLEFLKAHT